MGISNDACRSAEDRAKVEIDRMLAEAEWKVQDKRRATLSAGRGVAVRESTHGAAHWRWDYALYVDRQLVCAIEAKSEGITSTWACRRGAVSKWTVDFSITTPRKGAVLLGRRTDLEFATLWPNEGSDVLMAGFLNNSPKYVVSTTLDTLEWANSSLVTGDLAEAVGKLKQQPPGKNPLIPGSPTLVRSLRDGLPDELSLNVCPVVVGSGMRLFDEIADQVRLKLVGSRTLSTGVVGVTYQPASA